MYQTPTLTPAKSYEMPVLIDIKEVSAFLDCVTGGGAKANAEAA